MRIIINFVAALVFLGGLVALGYALYVALPYLNAEPNSPLVSLIYQKATFYGIVSIACFGLTGILIAIAGSAYRSKTTA